MKRIIKPLIMLAMCSTLNVHADAQLTFTITAPDTQTSVKKISLARFFARIEDPSEPQRYLLYQTGKFFPLFAVDQSTKTYTRLTPEVKATLHAGLSKTELTEQNQTGLQGKDAKKHQDNPSQGTSEKENVIASRTSLRPTKKQQTIAGIKCRVIEELLDDQAVMSHCMADKSRLGMSEREVRSMARVFQMARERDYQWLGTATEDEKFVSIQSRDLSSNMTLELASVSTKPLPAGYLRIPKNYQEVDAKIMDK